MTWITNLFVLLVATATQGRLREEAIHSIDHRIVNGEPAQPGEFPSQVSLQYKERHICGGSILNENWVLTAAHCLDLVTPNGTTVLAGTIDLKNGGSRHEALGFLTHEHYDTSDSIINDIALIKVSPPFEMDGINMKPVNLPAEGENPAEGNLATVVGWGVTENGTIPDILRKVDNFIVNQYTCRAAYYGFHIYDTMICSGSEETKGACSADSGGPLYVNETIVGIVSWGGSPCGDPKSPMVYTRVSSYISWIKEDPGV